jgi:hypothetical protein
MNGLSVTGKQGFIFDVMCSLYLPALYDASKPMGQKKHFSYSLLFIHKGAGAAQSFF